VAFANWQAKQWRKRTRLKRNGSGTVTGKGFNRGALKGSGTQIFFFEENTDFPRFHRFGARNFKGKAKIHWCNSGSIRIINPTGITSQRQISAEIFFYIKNIQWCLKKRRKLSTPNRREVQQWRRGKIHIPWTSRQIYIFQQGLKTWWFMKVTAQQPFELKSWDVRALNKFESIQAIQETTHAATLIKFHAISIFPITVGFTSV